MRPRPLVLLDHIHDACEAIRGYIHSRTAEDFGQDRMLRDAIERNLITIGEAVTKLTQEDAATAARISDYREIIGLRNFLVHVYEDVNADRVWSIARDHVPMLLQEVSALRSELEGQS